ncbi:NAD(P)H-binding protein [Shewanella sp. AS16]|uniref:NAD(P)-dependent oxidoreductase n=1 Tax=Shewanella sp. AS16 TaxID=2907625 RepID=UPI001F323D25|nr:NAD(P)H-binding protein [Shewanella sp. AS16]MCE9687348.1 NAD(P)H-binding protein [Shewanella sp. AS16]
MKITLFGATGKTGIYLIQEGLKRGFEITVFARSNSQFEHPDVQIVRGDFTNQNLLREAIRDSDAVLSALGPANIPHPNGIPITKATDAIISAMKLEGLDRLVAISTGTAVDPDDGIDMKIWLPAQLIKFTMPKVYKDIVGMAKTIRASGLNWTMVRVALLKSIPASNRLNVGLYGHVKHNLKISREDVAKFMFDQILTSEFVNKAPGISTQ